MFRKLKKYLVSFILLVTLLGAKPNEIVEFEQIYPLVIDTFNFSCPTILKIHRTYSFPGNKFISVVDLIDQRKVAISFEYDGLQKSIPSYVLSPSINLTKGEPKFFANYNCQTCLSWMIYWSTEDSSDQLIIAKLNKELPKRGDKGYAQSKYIEFSVVNSSNLSLLVENYKSNKIKIGESSPWGCYFISHSTEDKDENDGENLWLCKEMNECKKNLTLNKE